MSAYRGDGDAWADFLHHRARVLAEWWDEGKTPEESARLMSMDPVQVQMILGHVLDNPEMYGRTTKKGRTP